MSDLTDLNITEGGRPVTRPSLPDEDIRAFQTHFGIVLPDDYLRLLRFSNGGHPELDTIQPIARPDASAWAVNHFYHLSQDRTSFNSLWRAKEVWQKRLGGDAFPIAEDRGGNQFFLDLGTTPASVCVCVHDDNFETVSIAPTLEAFLNALAVDPDDR